MKLVFATHNQHKLQEVSLLLPESIELLSLNDIGCNEEIHETGETLENNAKIKANFVTSKYGYDCFADDTGLLVDALNGAPGVFSARYAGEQKDVNDNMDKLLAELKDKSNRSARFKTVIIMNLNGEQKNFEGSIEGEILKERKGKKGFGYDPIFQPLGYDQTFAQLPLVIKNSISHRGKAMQELITYLKSVF